MKTLVFCFKRHRLELQETKDLVRYYLSKGWKTGVYFVLLEYSVSQLKYCNAFYKLWGEKR